LNKESNTNIIKKKGKNMKIKVTKRPTTTKEKVIGGVGWIAVIGCIAYLIMK
jgi:hypothetical protein